MTTITVPVRIVFTNKKDGNLIVSYIYNHTIEAVDINRYEDSIDYVGRQFAEYKKMVNGKKLKNSIYTIHALDKEAVGKNYKVEI